MPVSEIVRFGGIAAMLCPIQARDRAVVEALRAIAALLTASAKTAVAIRSAHSGNPMRFVEAQSVESVRIGILAGCRP